MTEYEMGSLLAQLQTTIQVIYGTQIALISAFLVSAYYAAHRLTLLTVAIVIALYTAFLGWNVLTLSAISVSFVGLMEEMHRFAVAGKGLQWHVAASPTFFVVPLRWPMLAIGFVLYVATLIYFFHCRRVNRKTEMVEALKT